MATNLKEKPRAQGDTLVRALFFVYLLFLLWAILWKFNAPFVGDGTLRIVNLIPFGGNSYPEMRFNLLIFVPFGLFVSMLAPWRAWFWRVLSGLVASAALETGQYILAIGYSDITDVMMNALGGVVGIAAFSVISKLFGKNATIALRVLCVLITVLEAALAVAFAVRLRFRV